MVSFRKKVFPTGYLQQGDVEKVGLFSSDEEAL